MDLSELLDRCQLPVEWTGNDFAQFVNNLLQDFRSDLRELDASPVCGIVASHADVISKFCDAAPRVIKATFDGNPSKAYQLFEDAITPLLEAVEDQALALDPEALGYLYRVRRARATPLSREELFHIPFELRHLVATQRYSIPGLPCLYLAGSLYTCWVELGMPPLHELQVSAFWTTENARVLDLSNRPALLALYVENSDLQSRVANNLVLWPVIALCSIVVRHREGRYKPEYIFPQLVLEWLTHAQKFDAVCYFSTHVNALAKENPLAACNVVFPATDVSASGRCKKLRKVFRMTEPQPWELLDAIRVQGGGYPPSFDFEFIAGQPTPYRQSKFGAIETKLVRLAQAQTYAAESDQSLGMVAE